MTAIRIGLTRHGVNYVPALDGYQKGAVQDFYEVEAETGDLTCEEIAEVVFEAMNAPGVAIGSLAATILGSINNLFAQVERHSFQEPRALSVGDTVEIVGRKTLACGSYDWAEV